MNALKRLSNFDVLIAFVRMIESLTVQQIDDVKDEVV
jgi:hypothetical protein